MPADARFVATAEPVRAEPIRRGATAVVASPGVLHPAWLHPAEAEHGGYRLRWAALGVICLALFIGQIDVTIVNIALPRIAEDLDATTSDLQWVMDAYAVTLAGFVLFGGGLADRFGRKGVFITGLALFGVASIAATLAAEPWQLILARAVMGLGAALFFPPALSLMSVMFVPDERPRAVAVWAGVGGFATMLGPVLGGFLLDAFWWGSVFLVNVPVTVVGIVGAVILVPTSRRPATAPLDVPGAALSVLGLGALVFGLIEGPGRGWTSVAVLAALVVGAAGVVGFVLREASIEQPMVDVRVFARPRIAAGAAAITISLLGVSATLFLVPQLLQAVRDESTITVGLVFVPFGLTFGILAFTAAPATVRFGIRRVLVTGLSVMAMSFVVLAFVPETDGLVTVWVGLVLFAVGAAYAVPPATSEVMTALPASKAGDASAVNQITRQVGTALGAAVAGTILAAVYASQLTPALGQVPASETSLAESSITGAQQVAGSLSAGSGQLLDAADNAFSDGYRVAMLALAALTALANVAVVWLLRRRRS